MTGFKPTSGTVIKAVYTYMLPGEKLHFKMALTLEGGEFGYGALTLALFLAFCCKDSLDFLVIEPYKLIFKWPAWYV